jgi:hypothetical protein
MEPGTKIKLCSNRAFRDCRARKKVHGSIRNTDDLQCSLDEDPTLGAALGVFSVDGWITEFNSDRKTHEGFHLKTKCMADGGGVTRTANSRFSPLPQLLDYCKDSSQCSDEKYKGGCCQEMKVARISRADDRDIERGDAREHEPHWGHF